MLPLHIWQRMAANYLWTRQLFFDVDVDRAYARQRLATIETSVTIDSSADDVKVHVPNDNYNTKVAHNMATGFWKGDKFFGRLREDTNELIAT